MCNVYFFLKYDVNSDKQKAFQEINLIASIFVKENTKLVVFFVTYIVTSRLSQH